MSKKTQNFIESEIIEIHEFDFNLNSKQKLFLTTEYISNGYPGEYFHKQELSLEAYGNNSTFTLFGPVFTPANLRKLADQLEAAELKAKQKCS